MSEDNSVSTLVRELEQKFISGSGTQMSEYVRTDLYEDINTIYAYLNSKHISGSTDSLGRDKPFFNIVIAARNIWFRATDLDRNNINLSPSKEADSVAVFLLAVHLHDWMKRENFGRFLNTWGLELAGFNSSVVKFTEKDGRLIPSVIPWSRLIVDDINFADNPKIEILELTEAQLYERYDKKAVKELCDSARARETTGKKQKDTKSNYFKVYEVHGVFSKDKVTDKESDKDIFTQQMHVLSFLEAKKKGDKEEFTLFRGLEEKDPYKLTSLLPNTDGSISLDGAVKNLFEAQWMTNHTVKAIKDQLDLASKLIFQTSDGNFVGQNALFAIESGDILIHQVNQPITQINNNSHDITSLQNFGAQWKQLSSEINGISEAMLGVAPKSGVAWRQTEALLQESHSLFEIMTENKALALEEMLVDTIIPFIKKRHLNNNKEIVATLEINGIKQIEQKFIKNRSAQISNDMVKSMIMEGKEMMQPDINQIETEVQNGMAELGGQRFFAPSKVSWKEEFKDIEFSVDIDITGELKDKQDVMTTLNTALQAVVNPAFESNPKAQFIVDKILTATGHISPVELASIPKAPAPVAPEQAPELPS